MRKTVAITGVNSCFAKALLPHLQSDPEVERIIGIDVLPWRGGFEKVTFYKEDIRSPKMIEILDGVDTLYHLAFSVSDIHDRKKAEDININGSKNVFSACIRNKVKKVVFASSTAAYGAFKNTPANLDESMPLRENKGNDYNNHIIAVENLAGSLFRKHPEITLTALRTGFLFTPKMKNVFSNLFYMNIVGKPMGSDTHHQLIHEKDLGKALYLVHQKDVPGIYNVAADGLVSVGWAYKKAGVKTIPMPVSLLKGTAWLGFNARWQSVGSGWVDMAAHTISVNCDKFKKTTGWQPEYSSEDTFQDYLKNRSKKEDDSLLQSGFYWMFQREGRFKVFKFYLNGFKLGHIPGVRKVMPWFTPKDSSFSYLPINQSLNTESEKLPTQVIHNFIEESKHHVIMNECGCRIMHKCENFTHTVACLFMGETALNIPPGVSRRVTKEEAHAHVENALNLGLTPLAGKVKFDNYAFMIKDKNKLLSVCFCCHCCCMMREYRHVPAEQLDGVMPPVEGLEIMVTEECKGCGDCVEVCGWKAIEIKDEKAVHSGKCRGCGRCERYCPNNAVNIHIDNPNMVQDVQERIKEYIDVT